MKQGQVGSCPCFLQTSDGLKKSARTCEKTTDLLLCFCDYCSYCLNQELNKQLVKGTSCSMTSIGNQWITSRAYLLLHAAFVDLYQHLIKRLQILWPCVLWASKDLACFPFELMLCCGQSQVQTLVSDMLITASVRIGSWSKWPVIKHKQTKNIGKSCLPPFSLNVPFKLNHTLCMCLRKSDRKQEERYVNTFLLRPQFNPEVMGCFDMNGKYRRIQPQSIANETGSGFQVASHIISVC